MSRCLRAVLVSLGVGQAASVQVEQRTSSSASVLSQRDSRLVPQRLGAEEALLVSRKFQQLEEQFNAALNNDACAPGVCAPAAELTLGSPTTWFSSADVENLKLQVENQCKRSLCQPLCLHTGWDCAVKFTGSCSSNPPPSWCTAFKTQLEAENVQIALCAQIKAYACQSVLGCCAGAGDVVAQWMEQWVEDRVYGANAPVPALPIAACQGDIGDTTTGHAVCEQCKSSIEPVMTAVDCRWSQPTAFRPANDLDEDASPLDYPLDPFSQVGIDRAGVASKWKSYASRCKAQQKVFNSKAGDLASTITAERICACLGCCGGTSSDTGCFFPLNSFSPYDLAQWQKPETA